MPGLDSIIYTYAIRCSKDDSTQFYRIMPQSEGYIKTGVGTIILELKVMKKRGVSGLLQNNAPRQQRLLWTILVPREWTR